MTTLHHSSRIMWHMLPAFHLKQEELPRTLVYCGQQRVFCLETTTSDDIVVGQVAESRFPHPRHQAAIKVPDA